MTLVKRMRFDARRIWTSVLADDHVKVVGEVLEGLPLVEVVVTDHVARDGVSARVTPKWCRTLCISPAHFSSRLSVAPALIDPA
jgi:hypothetical protein